MERCAEKTIILSSGRCSWGKCLACGWGKLEGKPPSAERLRRELESQNLNCGRLKVFASGSFLDDAQFPAEFRKWFADFIHNRAVKELVIESRPEFISDETLKDFAGISLTVAIGLESANDAVLKRYNKGFTTKDYIRAAQFLKKHGAKLRTYIMVNLPDSAQKDLDNSVEFALEYSDSIVLINTFPHSKAELFGQWIGGKWKPYDKKQFEAAVKKWGKNKKVELDFQNYLFVPKFPREQRVMLRGVSEEFLVHPFYEVWQDYFVRFYVPPEEKTIALFLPCSFRKPYPESQTHLAITAALKKNKDFPKVHRIVISSPGVIPFEFANYYPFNAYDWEEWKEYPELMKRYEEVTKQRILNYLRAHRYKKHYVYMKPDSHSFAVLAEACKELKIKLINLVDEKTYETLKNEKNQLSDGRLLNSLGDIG